jgi:predicted 3-demethylubiquinone-9 3-methyltransferase (glyoxalase superfamily)
MEGRMPELHSKVRTCLWYDGNGHEAANFYVSLLPDSRIETIWPHPPDKAPLVVEFTLAGAPMMILNGGPHCKATPAASISVLTKDQDETDRLWDALLADGGAESMCGWLTDRWGVSWQITPEVLPRMNKSEDRVAAGRAFEAMMTMRKLDIAALEAAFKGE